LFLNKCVSQHRYISALGKLVQVCNTLQTLVKPVCFVLIVVSASKDRITLCFTNALESADCDAGSSGLQQSFFGVLI